jgi:LPS export ABC transporter protein LptC
MVRTCIPFLTLLFGLMVFACQSDREIAANAHSPKEYPDQEGWDATLTLSKNGNKSSSISYKHMAKYTGKKKVRFDQGVKIQFYDPGGKIETTVSAQEALLDEDNQNIEFNGQVVVNSREGIDLLTEKLLWQENDNKAITDAFVTVITTENDTIHGTGFESEHSMKTFNIKKPWGVTQRRLKLDEETR